MLFNSHSFIFLFLPTVLILYWASFARWGSRVSIPVLAAASLIFYWTGEHLYPWLLPLTIAVNYAFGLAITGSEGPRRKWIAGIAIGANLLALGYFKYFNFAVDQLVTLGLAEPLQSRVVLPIGISFFTFTQIAYLADVYARKATERSAAPYALFVTFFPHLIAGPILHHKEMMPQFKRPKRQRQLDLYAGLAMFTIGLAKKVLVADTCAKTSTELFQMAGGGDLGFINAWTAALAYTAQIYFDFSGYSDMALGLSRMLGIELPVNFNSPYKATSISDFWRRWHITLSRFLRDYLYIPLGGNRKGVARRYVNLLVTMVLGGIWHGAGWTFVIWGAMHGLAQALAAGWVDLRKRGRLFAIPAGVAWLVTVVFVIFAWVPFRAEGLEPTLSIWRGMVGLNGFAMPSSAPFPAIAQLLGTGLEAVTFNLTAHAAIAGALLLAFLAPNSQQIMRSFRVGLDSPGYHIFAERTRWRIGVNWASAIFLGLLAGLSIRAIAGYSEFIYFQF